jgi:hypothetical protein
MACPSPWSLTGTKFSQADCGNCSLNCHVLISKWALHTILKLMVKQNGWINAWRHFWDVLSVPVLRSGVVGFIWLNYGTTPVGIQHWVVLPLKFYMDILQGWWVWNLLMLLLYRCWNNGFWIDPWCKISSSNIWHTPKNVWNARLTRIELKGLLLWVIRSTWSYSRMCNRLWLLVATRKRLELSLINWHFHLHLPYTPFSMSPS